MAVEPFFTGTAVVVAVISPPIYAWLTNLHIRWIAVFSIITALLASEIVFRIARPDFHHGPLMGLGYVMNLFIVLFIVGVEAIFISAIRDREKS